MTVGETSVGKQAAAKPARRATPRKWDKETRTGLAGYTTVISARGAVTYRGERVRNYRDYLEVSDELGYVNWLVQFNRGVFMAPWGKSENWTLSVQHSEDDVRRYVDNFDYLGKALTA